MRPSMGTKTASILSSRIKHNFINFIFCFACLALNQGYKFMQFCTHAHAGTACGLHARIEGRGRGGGGGSAPLSLPFSRILLKIYKRNTEMNIEVPFSGPLFPELGSWSPFLTWLTLVQYNEERHVFQRA